MKCPVNLLLLSFLINSAQAQVFKCENKRGQIIYQDSVCRSTGKQSEIKLQPFDSTKTQAAQEKLQQDIQQREKLKAIEADRTLKERAIMAIEEQTKSNENLTRTAREQAEALDRNTRAVKSKNKSRVYYQQPAYRPHRIKKNRPEHSKQKTGLSVDISIK